MNEGVFYKGADDMQKYDRKDSKNILLRQENQFIVFSNVKYIHMKLMNEGEENGHKGQRLYY